MNFVTTLIMIANDEQGSPHQKTTASVKDGWMPSDWGKQMIRKFIYLILVTMLAGVVLAQA